jgi:hypothetical protein
LLLLSLLFSCHGHASQEVDEPLWATHYLPWATQHGYNAFHWPRPYTEKGDTREGIALLVRQAVFEVVGTSAVPFKELAPQPPPVGQGEGLCLDVEGEAFSCECC